MKELNKAGRNTGAEWAKSASTDELQRLKEATEWDRDTLTADQLVEQLRQGNCGRGNAFTAEQNLASVILGPDADNDRSDLQDWVDTTLGEPDAEFAEDDNVNDAFLAGFVEAALEVLEAREAAA